MQIRRKNLDFGQGFYVTDIREQAVKWAENMARNRKGTALLNRYILDREAVIREARCKIIKAYDEEWLEFIIANRSGEMFYASKTCANLHDKSTGLYLYGDMYVATIL